MKDSSLKTVNVYDVSMSSIEEMRFSKYVSNKGIAMNTKTKEERKKIATNWLKETRQHFHGKS